MHKQIEDYLQQVKAQLTALTEDQQREEIEETRQHLYALVANLQEKGLPDREVVSDALSQFGNAKAVGRSLNRAALPKPSFMKKVINGAAAGACLIGIYWPVVMQFYGRFIYPAGYPLSASLDLLTKGAIAGSMAGLVNYYCSSRGADNSRPLRKSAYGFLYGAIGGIVFAMCHFSSAIASMATHNVPLAQICLGFGAAAGLYAAMGGCVFGALFAIEAAVSLRKKASRRLTA